jgi:hypothetical protein
LDAESVAGPHLAPSDDLIASDSGHVAVPLKTAPNLEAIASLGC